MQCFHTILIVLLLGQAMDYCSVLDDFIAKNRELHKHELQDEDWEAIALVTQWLKSFQSTTTQMSMTKCPMLSWTHAIFHGLQDSLADSLRSLPNNTPALFIKVFSMPIGNLVTTTGNLMSHHIILGPHVCPAFYYGTLPC